MNRRTFLAAVSAAPVTAAAASSVEEVSAPKRYLSHWLDSRDLDKSSIVRVVGVDSDRHLVETETLLAPKTRELWRVSDVKEFSPGLRFPYVLTDPQFSSICGVLV
jgi:hypothetical protein